MYMHAAAKPDGSCYYEYALCYINNAMIISANQDAIIREFCDQFILKDMTSPGKSRQHYFGAMIGKYPFADGTYVWYMSVEDYLSWTIPTVEVEWEETLYKKASSPLHDNYHPEMDTTPLLSPNYS